jgi:hypothetical protein
MFAETRERGLLRDGCSVVSGSCAFMSCSTSPSAITLVASDMISMTRWDPMVAIIWKAREYTKSPTSTLAWLPKTLLAVARPRRFCEPSTTSSCSSVAVWMNSMKAAASMCLSLSIPHARPASTHSSGRRRLPPPAMMCSATWSTSGTVLLSRARIMASTPARSAVTSARISSSAMAGGAAPRGAERDVGSWVTLGLI